MINRAVTRIGAGVAVASAAVVLLALPASAHVEPSPIAVQAGTSATVSFGVEHGCDDSPLVKLEIQIPDGVTDVTPAPAPDGWTGTIADGVVTFEGGPQPAHEGIDFAIDATFPDTPDAMIGFPTVETCQEGSVSWIEPVVKGEDEPEKPAPTVLLTAAAPTEAQLTPAEEGDEGGHEGAGHDEVATTTAAPSDEDSSSNTGLIVGIVVAVIAVAGVGVVLVRRRKA